MICGIIVICIISALSIVQLLVQSFQAQHTKCFAIRTLLGRANSEACAAPIAILSAMVVKGKHNDKNDKGGDDYGAWEDRDDSKGYGHGSWKKKKWNDGTGWGNGKWEDDAEAWNTGARGSTDTEGTWSKKGDFHYWNDGPRSGDKRHRDFDHDPVWSFSGPQAEDKVNYQPAEEEPKAIIDKIPKPLTQDQVRLPNFDGGNPGRRESPPLLTLPCDMCNKVFHNGCAMLQCVASNGQVLNNEGAGAKIAKCKAQIKELADAFQKLKIPKVDDSDDAAGSTGTDQDNAALKEEAMNALPMLRQAVPRRRGLLCESPDQEVEVFLVQPEV